MARSPARNKEIALMGKSILSSGSTSADFERNSANITFVRGMVQPISNLAESLDSMSEEQSKYFAELIQVMKRSVRSEDTLEQTQKELSDKIASLIASLTLADPEKNKGAIDQLRKIHKGVEKGTNGSRFLQVLLGEEYESKRAGGATAGALFSSGAKGFYSNVLSSFGVTPTRKKSELLNDKIARHMDAQSTLGEIAAVPGAQVAEKLRVGRAKAGPDDSGYGPGKAPAGTGTPKAILNRIAREVTLIRMVVEGRLKYVPANKRKDIEEGYQKLISPGAKGRPELWTNVGKKDKELLEAVKHAIDNKGVPMPNDPRGVDRDSRDDHEKLLASVDNTSSKLEEKEEGPAEPKIEGPSPAKKVIDTLEKGAVGGFLAKFLKRGLFKEGEKEAVKAGAKVAAKEGEKVAVKGAAKFAGKEVLKEIPVLGLALGLGFGAWRAMKGDFAGAGLEAVSGAASTLPGVGTAASLAIDAGLAVRDVKNAGSVAASSTSMGSVMQAVDQVAKSPVVQTQPQIVPVPTPVVQKVVETQTLLPTRPTDSSFMRFQDRRQVRTL